MTAILNRFIRFLSFLFNVSLTKFLSIVFLAPLMPRTPWSLVYNSASHSDFQEHTCHAIVEVTVYV